MKKDVSVIIQEAVNKKYGTMSTRALAGEMGNLSHTTISKFLKGNIQNMESEKLYSMCDKLDLNMTDLLKAKVKLTENRKLNEDEKPKKPYKLGASKAMELRQNVRNLDEEILVETTDYETYDPEIEELRAYSGRYFTVIDSEENVPGENRFRGNEVVSTQDIFYIKILADTWSYIFTKDTYLAVTNVFQTVDGEAILEDKDLVILKFKNTYSIRKYSIENGISVFRKLSNNRDEFDITPVDSWGEIEIMGTIVHASKTFI